MCLLCPRKKKKEKNRFDEIHENNHRCFSPPSQVLQQLIYVLQKLDVNAETVDDVLVVAHRLAFSEVVSLCEEFIVRGLSMTSTACLKCLKLGENFDLPRITDSAVECLQKNFEEVSSQEQFLEISKKALEYFIQSDSIGCQSEIDVFRTVVRWVNHDSERQQFSGELLQNVRYGLMQPNELLSEVLPHPLTVQSKECQDLIKKAIAFHTDNFSKPLVSESWCRPRDTEDCLLHSVRRSGTKVVAFSVKKGPRERKLSTRNPDWYLRPGASVQIGHNLFILGGGSFNQCWRFNSLEESWEQLKSMPGYRQHHTAVRFDKDKVIIAGDFSCMIRTCIYNIRNNSWSAGPDFPKTRWSMAGCTFKEEAYFTGGDVDTVPGNNTHRFDSCRQTWIRQADMRHARSNHTMCGLNDKIYVFGGKTSDEGEVLGEYYTPGIDQWTTFKCDLGVDRTVASGCIVHNQIYVLSDESGCYCFNPENKTFAELGVRFSPKINMMVVMPFRRSRFLDDAD